MQVQCEYCSKWGMMGSDIYHVNELDKFVCIRCYNNIPCDYCERRGRLGETIKYCKKCRKLFCPGCYWKLPQRGVNAFKEKVLGQHTGRYR